MMRLKLVEGKQPEAEWSECLEDYGVYGETMDGTPFVVATDRVEVSLKDGSRIRTLMRPLPPGTVITITVRDAAPHNVQVVKPSQGAEWLEWWRFESGDVAVSKHGNWYLKLPNGDGYRFRSDIKTELVDMQKEVYRRPFAPWHLAPVEEPTP